MTLVADAIATYDALLVERHAAMRAHLARAVAVTPGVDECRVLRPFLIDRESHASALAATAHVNEALVIAARRLRGDPALRRSLGIPAYLDELLLLDDAAEGQPSLMARIDGLVAPDGTYRVIEYNAQPEFGPARAIDAMFASSPLAGEFAAAYVCHQQQLDEYAVDAVIAAAGHPAPVIGVPQGHDRARDWLSAARVRGCRVSFAPYEKYRFVGGRLVVDHEGGPQTVDVIALPWRDLAAPTAAMRPVLDAARGGAVRTLDGLSLGLLCSYKHTFELLSDPDHAAMFPPVVAAALARHVPWTRIVRDRKTSYGGGPIDLVPFLASHREKLVLKPSGGARGEGVVLGRLVDDATWARTLARARKQPYVAQDWIEGERAPYPPSTGAPGSLVTATSDFNTFVWNGDATRGAQVRLSTTGKHTPEEAWVTGLWVVERARARPAGADTP